MQRVTTFTPRHRLAAIGMLIAAATQQLAWATGEEASTTALPVANLSALAPALQVGDLVFIRIGFKPFAEVALVTDTWTNHVGVVVDVSGDEALIAESTFPLSRITTLARFVSRTADRRFAVMRLNEAPSAEQQAQIGAAARRRLGVFYDTGFDLKSRRQFCSRFVHEVLQEATGRSIGEVETFEQLLTRHPDAHLSFWKTWYFGRIPWQRETVTPASVMRSPQLHPVFDGAAMARR